MSFYTIRAACVAALLYCLLVLSVSAQTTTVASSKLSLRDAISATLAKHPQLTSFELRRQALDGELHTAGLHPAFRLDSTVENFAGSGAYNGTKGAEFTLALSSVIELGGKRDARLGVVTGRQHELAAQQRIVELDLLAEVTRRFIEAARAQQHLDLQRATLELAKEITRSMKKRVDAGNIPDAELARAQANQARMAIQLRQAELGFDAAKVKLSSMWAVAEPAFTAVNADLLNPGDTPPITELINGLANNPDVQLFASEARLRDAEVRLALSQRKADLEWNAGLRRLQASKDSAFVVGVSLPLFSGNRAAGEVAVAKANRLRVDSEHEAALLQLRAQLVALYQERQAALFEMASLRDEVILQLKKAVSGTRTAFDKGRYSYLELSTAQHELLNAESALIDAAAQAHLLRAEIERLTGVTTTQDIDITIEHAELIEEVAP